MSPSVRTALINSIRVMPPEPSASILPNAASAL
jgi:hypothetical protein